MLCPLAHTHAHNPWVNNCHSESHGWHIHSNLLSSLFWSRGVGVCVPGGGGGGINPCAFLHLLFVFGSHHFCSPPLRPCLYLRTDGFISGEHLAFLLSFLKLLVLLQCRPLSFVLPHSTKVHH